jgi:glutaredoxin
MNKLVAWSCPYCGLTNNTLFPNGVSGEPVVVYCDIDIGGCEKMVVLTAREQITTCVRKVEGE